MLCMVVPIKNWPKPEDFRPETDKEIVEYFTRAGLYMSYGALNLLFGSIIGLDGLNYEG